MIPLSGMGAALVSSKVKDRRRNNRPNWRGLLRQVGLCLAAPAILLFSSCATPNLLEEITQGNEDRALQLIEEKRDLEIRDEGGYTPLHMSVLMGSVEVADALLVNGVDVNTQSYDGSTPLHLLIEEAITDDRLFRLLIHKGAAIEAKDNRGQTPLMVLCQREPGRTDVNGQVAMVKSLIKYGGEPGAIKYGGRVDERDKKGMTPLHHAAATGQSAIVSDQLLKNGAEIDSRNKDGYSPLHLAAEGNHTALAIHLIRKGAKPSLVEENKAKTVTPWSEYDIRHNYEANGKTFRHAGGYYEAYEDDESARELYRIALEQFEFATIEYQIWSDSFEKWIKDAKAENVRKMVASIAVTAAAMASGVPVSISTENTGKVAYFRRYSDVYQSRARECAAWAAEARARSQELGDG